jgi:plasmid stabilization system protein ParE
MPHLSRRAQKDFEGLPDSVARKAQTLLDKLDAEPATGTKLHGRLAGLRSAWLGRSHRVIYTHDGDQAQILTICPRKDAYR